ncbi:MAG: nucleotidyltransferase domain-containing protein, partial [Cellulosilyticaceae bacterium]
MPHNIEQEVKNLIQVIKDVTHTNKIYLFGSYAYGTPNEDSDIDLCVVTDDTEIRKIDLMKRIRKAIAHTA